MAWWCSSQYCVVFIRVWYITRLLDNLFMMYFIFRKYMVQNLWFLLSLDYQPFSITDHFRFRIFCCAFNSLVITGTLSWWIFDVPWPPFLHIHHIWLFWWRLRSVFSERSQTRLSSVSLASFRSLSCYIPYTPWLSCPILSSWGISFLMGYIIDLTNCLVFASLFVHGVFLALSVKFSWGNS